jgi:hypothetical protein
MSTNPNGRAAEPPGGRNLSYAFGDVGDVARFDSEAVRRFLEDGQVWFVTAGLFNKVELHPQLLDCCCEQVVVDIRDDGKPV